jgi:Tol biopolymer transport system component
MSLPAGTRLGPYEILAPLGAGGMGEVYRARDTRLDRTVAIKILPDAFANDPERLARFEREAKMLAALNHPNIAQIYGIERLSTGSGQALVMELVEGEDLSARIGRGPIPIDEALAIARQIAQALEAAHERGIIHRDLKPANVKVRHDGAVKVLDFGLAKGFDAASQSGDAMNSPTITSPATQLGTIIGTAAYMSPEQARGKATDRRADVWAFGVVLLEMLTGQRAFKGDEISDVLASVLKDAPAFDSLPAATPKAIRRLLRRCLEKDRSRRLDSMADARLEIDDALAAAPEERPALAADRFTWARALPWAVAAIAVAVAASATLRRNTEDQPSVLYASIDAPAGHVLGEAEGLLSLPTRTPMVFTPDGRSLIVHATASGKQQLFLRALDTGDVRPIAGTEGAHVPFVSPDGKWIGFWAANELRKVPIEGGQPITICPLRSRLGPNGASWGSDDVIVFGDDTTWRLMKVVASGGIPAPVGPAPESDRQHVTPVLLQGGRRVLYGEVDRFDATASRLLVTDIDAADSRVVIEQASDGRLLPNGDLAFMRLGTLMVAPFDTAEGRVTGEALPVMQRVMQSGLRQRAGALNTGAGMFAVSSTGMLAVIKGGVLGAAENRLVWSTASGSVSAEPAGGAPEGRRGWSRISPDGGRALIYVDRPVGPETWIADWTRNVWVRCPDCPARGRAEWSSDGERIVWGGGDSLVVRSQDGSAPEQVLLREPGRRLQVTSWLADGRIVYLSSPDFAAFEVKVLAPGAASGTLILPSGVTDEVAVSADGKWLAYSLLQSDPFEVVVQPLATGGPRVQVSAGGGRNAVWAPDSRTLYYLEPTAPGRFGNVIYAVDAIADGAIRPGTPREVLRHARAQGCVPGRCYDLSPDGKRFLFRETHATGAPAVSRMDLILNWASTLGRAR